MTSIGIVGGRGFVGAELLRLIDGHSALELAFACSRSMSGQVISRVVPNCRSEIAFENLTPQQIEQRNVDVIVLALPNEAAAPYLDVLINTRSVILDLSADYRFDNNWYYGLPEFTRAKAEGQRLISNPGCYATAMQLAVRPLQQFLERPPTCFGISGYSGAGSTPSPKNDPDNLRNNIIPYSSINHIHEREVTRQLAHEVHFSPNVAEFFRGIAMTANIFLNQSFSLTSLHDLFAEQYEDDLLIEVVEQAPHVSSIVNQDGAKVGGLMIDPSGKRVVVHSVLDNLLKGAASQAIQNINLACGLFEYEGLQVG